MDVIIAMWVARWSHAKYKNAEDPGHCEVWAQVLSVPFVWVVRF